MAINFGGGTDGRVDFNNNASNLGTDPVTVAFWMFHVTASTFKTVFQESTLAAGGDFAMGCAIGNPATRLRVIQTFTAGSYQWDWDVLTTGVWHHIAWTYDRGSPTTDPVFYLNGVDQGAPDVTDEVSGGVVRPAADSIRIGNFPTGSPSSAFTGYLAEFGRWQVELSAGEIMALAKGASPNRIRRSGLALHLSMHTTGNLVDLVTGAVGAGGGTLATVAHPPVEMPMVPPLWTPYTVAAPVGIALPVGTLSMMGAGR